MTGLDRLHEIAEDVGRTVWLRDLGAALRDIAYGIEGGTRDLSGYESDVLAWVEKNGGLDAVKRMVPDLGADRKPICRFDEVWTVDGDGPYHVASAWQDGTVSLVETVGYVECRRLTHECPDSWERLEGDANALAEAETNGRGIYNVANDYCNARGLGDGTVWVLMVRDLVRRAKKLAGVSE